MGFFFPSSSRQGVFLLQSGTYAYSVFLNNFPVFEQMLLDPDLCALSRAQVQKLAAEVAGKFPARLVYPETISRLERFCESVDGAKENSRGVAGDMGGNEGDDPLASPGTLAVVGSSPFEGYKVKSLFLVKNE